MRLCHNEWEIDPPVISLKVLEKVLPLFHDVRHVQTMLVSLNTLAQLLDARVLADHACDRAAQGKRTTPEPEVDGTRHQAIADWVKNAMGSLENILEKEQNGRNTEAWKDEKDRLDKATGGWRWRIACDSAMIQGKYFLQTQERVSGPDRHEQGGSSATADGAAATAGHAGGRAPAGACEHLRRQ
jgi:hypothetical protein